MTDDEAKLLTGVPAVMYTALWHARGMGFRKRILDELKITRMAIYVHFDDYPPGGLSTIDGEKGDYDIISIEGGKDINDVPCDCAVTGQMKPVVQLLEHGKNLLLGLLVLVLQRRIRIKGLFKLVKVAKLVLRCI